MPSKRQGQQKTALKAGPRDAGVEERYEHMVIFS